MKIINRNERIAYNINAYVSNFPWNAETVSLQ